MYRQQQEFMKIWMDLNLNKQD